MRRLFYSRVRNFWLLSRKQKKVVAESWFWIQWAAVQLRFRPFKKLSAHMGQVGVETEKEVFDPKRVALAIEVLNGIDRASKCFPLSPSCYSRAIAAARMLNRRNLPFTIYIGVLKEEEGGLKAHAWTRSGSVFVTGAEVMTGYQVLAYFGKMVDS